MNGQDLVIRMRDLQLRLDACLAEFGKWGKDRAKAEYDYKIENAAEILKQRTNGIPVTILSDVVKGQKGVAEKRLNRDVADVMYNAAREHINAIKLEMRVIQDQIEREWNKA
ncbi:MAG: hypothetical protein VB081_10025 [Christensenella sp.]|uniref:hypothetical protein n=1 Tax=Christensenella sp. TaxID=1935934 RepID=UPI002B20B582|nr:hypothetical protein [Christensenella sp.]MEA5003823.1 hypothetical protein [Christensenella sp.]